VSGFPLRGSVPYALLRFHLPLIEPDVRISRIRLSDKRSYLRPRKVAGAQFQSRETQRVI
jgi:hypothetical protein